MALAVSWVIDQDTALIDGRDDHGVPSQYPINGKRIDKRNGIETSTDLSIEFIEREGMLACPCKSQLACGVDGIERLCAKGRTVA